MKIHFTKEAEARTPSKAYKGDAGFDLYCSKEVTIPSGMSGVVPTGIKIALPPNYWAQIVTRSSTLKRHGLVIIEAVIDNGYRGDLFVQVINTHRDRPVYLKPGDRIAQLIPHLIWDLEWVEVEQLSETDRSSQGFGSSGR